MDLVKNQNQKADNYAKKATDVGNVSLYSDTIFTEREPTDRNECKLIVSNTVCNLIYFFR